MEGGSLERDIYQPIFFFFFFIYFELRLFSEILRIWIVVKGGRYWLIQILYLILLCLFEDNDNFLRQEVWVLLKWFFFSNFLTYSYKTKVDKIEKYLVIHNLLIKDFSKS